MKVITGELESRRATLVEEFDTCESGNGDLIGWLMLLDRLHDLEHVCFNYQQTRRLDGLDTSGSSSEKSAFMSCPAITFRKHSWDMFPFEVTRPLASSNLGTIITLAHRLGMVWMDVRPGDGVLRAEGNGQCIIPLVLKGCNIHVQYSHDVGFAKDLEHETFDSVLIPSDEADKLGFGIISGCEDLNLPEFFLCGSDDRGEMTGAEIGAVKEILEILEVRSATQNEYVEYMKHSARLSGFSDLICLVAPFLPIRGSCIVQIMRPHRNVHDSPMFWYEGFAVFHSRLQEHCESSEASRQTIKVLKDFEYMKENYALRWLDETENEKTETGRPTAFLEDLRRKWQSTSSYFQDLEKRYRGPCSCFRYKDLVAAHMAQAIRCTEHKTASMHYTKPWWHRKTSLSSERRDRIAQAMQYYIDKLPEIAAFMAEKGVENEGLVTDAWWTMVFRAMCWHRAVSFVPETRKGVRGMTVPAEFYGSRIPVYIS